MNSKRLIIAFFAVSLAALAASCAAVISVARTYNSMLANEEITSSPKATSAETEERTLPEVTKAPEVTEQAEDVTASVPEEVTSDDLTTDVETTDTETTEEITLPESFTLILDGDRLVILTSEGKRVYERIIDVARMHPKDHENLLNGIVFETRDDAMSAVYDIIS